MIDVPAYMNTWALWRSNGCRRVRIDPALGASIPSMTGKIMDGMRSTVCPACRGEGRMPITRHGVRYWEDPCPQCHGWGKVRGNFTELARSKSFDCPFCLNDKGEPTGEILGRTCFKCGGTTVKTDVFLKVNPASIRSTRFTGANEDDDPVSMMIDRTVAGWSAHDETLWFHIVTCVEYSVGGRQQDKAEYAQRLYRRLKNYRKPIKRISQSWYSRNLEHAHTIVGRKLHVMLDSQS